MVALFTAPLWGAPKTEAKLLDHLQQKVRERSEELQDLYRRHDLEPDWAEKNRSMTEPSNLETRIADTRRELKILETKINMVKVKQSHGIDIALSGMLIVFVGLASISLFIAVLPKALALQERKPAPSSRPAAATGPSRTPTDSLDDETLAALALVLHAEAERASGQNLKVTLGLNPSPWALSSQMRVIPGRIQS